MGKTTKKKSKIGWVILALLVAGVGVVGYGAWDMFGEKITAANTVTKVQDRLYTMEYVGDYGFDEYLKQGGGSTSDEMANYLTNFLSGGFASPLNTSPMEFGCSTISVKTESGAQVFGRNYDWEECTAMIVHTKHTNGYESVSTACLDFLGFGEDWLPEGMGNQMMALASIYTPLDGMNEKGLVIADLMAGDQEITNQSGKEGDLTTTAGIRLVLDHAGTVDEALNLLDKYNMHSDIGAAHHYAISDRTGRSVVVEYVNNERIVTETKIVTNHYLAKEKEEIGSEQSHQRFSALTSLWESKQGIMSAEDVRDGLKSVSQGQLKSEYEVTQWSCVYEQESLQVHFYWEENYENSYTLTLKSDVWFA